jgi:hypothetical protein
MIERSSGGILLRQDAFMPDGLWNFIAGRLRVGGGTNAIVDVSFVRSKFELRSIFHIEIAPIMQTKILD